MKSARAVRAAILVVSSFLSAAAKAAGEGPSLSARIDSLVSPLYPAGQPGAVVLVGARGEVQHRKAYGSANLEFGALMTPEAVFRVASVTKLFTAVAVLVLEEDGKLVQDDDVTRFLPDFPARGITLRHLLTHTSGIHDYLDRPDASEWIRQERTLPELLASFQDRDLDFAPGTAAAYSNSNYALLAAVVEAASGKEYAAFLRERVFLPAGMKDTLCGDDTRIVPRRAAGYSRGPDGELRNERFSSMTVLRGCGDVLSTADDLHAFFDALLAGRLIGQEALARSFEPARLPGGESARFGAGWELDQVGGRRVALKGGAISGFCHYVCVLPDEGVHVIFLTNLGPEQEHRPGQLMLKIAAMTIER